MHQERAVRDIGDPHPGDAFEAIDDVVGKAGGDIGAVDLVTRPSIPGLFRIPSRTVKL